LLDHSEVVGYLLDRGLLTPRHAVDGTIVVRDASSRNRTFVVEGGDGFSSFVLKQGTGPSGIAAVAQEAAVYQMLEQRGGRLATYLPQVCGYDSTEQVLILRKVSGARDLRVHHLRSGRFSRALAASVGDALGSLHQATTGDVPGTAVGRQPWVLSVHQPSLIIFREASSAALELIRILQSAPEFGDRLDALRNQWEPSCLIHHDVKWDNLLACPAANGQPGKRLRLRIIDWESAQPGDPRWDLGSVFSHYLSLWLFSIPITGEDPPERFPELARLPLGRMQPAMADCWSAYQRRMGLDGSRDTPWLLAAVSYAGARLVQTAFEAAQVATHLDSRMLLHLQLASNILDRPRETAIHLLGLPVGPRR
jgi:aminoglycoside phosphotransferase (APT) family kinase protein